MFTRLRRPIPYSRTDEYGASNRREQCWVWGNDGTDYYYDKHEWVRVRVEQADWHDISPLPPSEREVATSERRAPYSITASMTQSALGPIIWW